MILLVSEKCRFCGIYRRMYDVFVKEKVFTNGLNMGLLPRAKIEKTVHRVETHGLNKKLKKTCLVNCFFLVSWHINLCRLFNAKSILQINSSTPNNSV